MLEAKRDLAGKLDLSREHQARFHATPSHLQRDKTCHLEVSSAGRESISEKKRAKIERDLHPIPFQVDSLNEYARMLRRLELLVGFDLGIDCLDRLLKFPGSEATALSVEASAPRSERICRMPTIIACSVRSAGRRHPRSSGFVAPLTSRFETKYR